ncbi:hypothetical protein KBB92_02190 [Candidatus Shapirobacteria bacterium]|jgi:hypothetical protein|nr:hypothetical protein [Candidatus Shapirobacteria bacterium]
MTETKDTRNKKQENKGGFGWLKVVGVLGAGLLIVFGSFQNVWRTLKMLWKNRDN